jgi:predicted metal-dependent peptidase
MSNKIDFDKHPMWSEIPISGMEAEELLRTARLQLFMHKKFFGRLAMRCQFIQTMQIPTAAIDVRGRFYYNKWFINNCRLADAIFIVAHEVFHLVQRSHARFPQGGIHQWWNEASDCVNNRTLREAKIVPREEIQEWAIGYNEMWDKYEGWVTEAIYYDLIKEAKDNTDCEACKKIAEGILKQHQNRSKAEAEDEKGEDGDEGEAGDGDEQGEGGGDSDEHEHGEGGEGCGCGCEDMPEHTCRSKGMCTSGVTSDPSNATEVGDAEDLHKWQRGIVGAAEGLDRGELPGEVQRILDDLVKPSVTWKDVIRAKASAIFGKGRYQWKRPGRRSQATGVRFPSRKPEEVGALIWLDTSMSISPTSLRQFASECLGILTQTGCNSILIGCHDVNAYNLQEVKSREDILAIEHRGGGTSHLDVFEVTEGKVGAEKIELPKGYKVGMVVCMTDMCSEFPPDCQYEVVWGVPSEYFHNTDNRYGAAAKFGREVEVTIDPH